MKMKILGCDPGLSGGLALVSEDGVMTEPMPTIEGQLDISALSAWIGSHADDIQMAYLEKVHAMPAQGVSSVFKFGRVYGILEGVLSALKIPYELVTPQKWMKEMHQGIEGGLDSKDRSRLAVSRLFPGLDLRASPRCKKAHEGMVEALLIAAYGRRKQKQDH